jgi:LmbE family N-acetylglucosaminyl deacetylase
MTRRLVFSPHADDAVLSCYGALGKDTDVVTVLAGVPEDADLLTDWDRRLGAGTSRGLALRRLDEDVRSFAGTGVRLEQWSWLDGQYRPGELPQGLLPAMRARIRDASEVWLPAGLLSHADHILVRDTGLAACAELAREGVRPEVVLYAEYPYQLFQMGNARRAAGTHAGFDWSNEDPTALTDWARGLLPQATAPHHTPQETPLAPDAVAAKDASIRAHATQVDEMDRQVHGRLLKPDNLRREYWWPLRSAESATDDLNRTVPAGDDR